jgi:hypothetical protein
MAQQTINIGTVANDGTGDPLRSAFDKVNDNFTELYADDAGDVNSVSAGVGISVDQTTGAVTVTNDAPNYDHTGDVTGATALTIADDVIDYANLGAEYKTNYTNNSSTGTVNLDWGLYSEATLTLTGATDLTYTNFNLGDVKYIVCTGDFALTFQNTGANLAVKIAGDYDGTVTNLIQMVKLGYGLYYYTISQPA